MGLNLCIAGTGKIARDLGVYFVKKGHAVTWVSSNEAFLMDAQEHIGNMVRMFMKYSGGAVRSLSAGFALYNEIGNETFDAVIECTTEDLGIKQAAFAKLIPYCKPNCLLLSASSSLLPSQIHEHCIGFHPFYPMELTAIVEVVFTSETKQDDKNALLKLCESFGICPVLQTQENAFAINRLLLPLQNEVFRALENGASVAGVDFASQSRLFPKGQIEFIKKVGTSVVSASVNNYVARMPVDRQKIYLSLVRGLESLVAKKEPGKTIPMPDGASRLFYYLFINTCLQFIRKKEMTVTECEAALDDVFGAECTLAEALQTEGMSQIKEVLTKEYAVRNVYYFEPSALLDAGLNV